MRRWLRIGVLAGTLFAINVIARLWSRLGYGDGTPDHLAAQERLSWAGWSVLVLVMAVAAGWWATRRPQGEVAGELAGGAGLAGLLYVVVGPFVSEPPRYSGGIGGSIIDLSLYLGVAAAGAVIGLLLVTATGRDYRSMELRRYARSSRPRRAVRG